VRFFREHPITLAVKRIVRLKIWAVLCFGFKFDKKKWPVISGARNTLKGTLQQKIFLDSSGT
jgi:hypothetical protein